MIQLPNNKKCYNLAEQVAQNLLNITYLAEQYKNIDELPAVWRTYKEEFDSEMETFEGWTTTFEGWDHTLSTYLANMSSAAVGAIAGQNIAPAAISATGAITGASITENMVGYLFAYVTNLNYAVTNVYAGIVKNGNKLTIANAIKITKQTGGANRIYLGEYTVPSAVLAKLFPVNIGANVLASIRPLAITTYDDSGQTVICWMEKTVTGIKIALDNTNLTADTEYYLRFDVTFLLSDNLGS